jgi:hypothetical protein
MRINVSIVKGFKECNVLCLWEHISQLDAFHNILRRNFLGYMLACVAVNIRIDEDITVAFREAPLCFSCRCSNAADVIDGPFVSFVY